MSKKKMDFTRRGFLKRKLAETRDSHLSSRLFFVSTKVSGSRIK